MFFIKFEVFSLFLKVFFFFFVLLLFTYVGSLNMSYIPEVPIVLNSFLGQHNI